MNSKYWACWVPLAIEKNNLAINNHAGCKTPSTSVAIARIERSLEKRTKIVCRDRFRKKKSHLRLQMVSCTHTISRVEARSANFCSFWRRRGWVKLLLFVPSGLCKLLQLLQTGSTGRQGVSFFARRQPVNRTSLDIPDLKHGFDWHSWNNSLTKILMSTHENLMRFSWENENCQRFSWESHELFTKSHENLTRFSFSRENWNVFSWDFLAFMSFSWDFSWVSHEILVSLFFHVKIGTLSHENLMRMSRDSHEHFWAFSHENSEYGDWCLHWILIEILMRFSRGLNFLTRFSWECSGLMSFSRVLMRFSRDSHEIIMRFLWDSHEIQVYRYNEHKPNPSFLFFNFFFCTTCYVLWSDPGCKKINNIFCIYIYKNLLKSDSHSLIQTFPLLVLATLNN